MKLINWTTGSIAYPAALLVAADHVWTGNYYVSPSTIYKLDPKTGHLIGSLNFPDDDQHCWIDDMIYVPIKGKIYVIFHNAINQNITVSEVDPLSLEYRDVVHNNTLYGPGGGFPVQLSLAADDTYLYVGCERLSIQNACVARFALSEFSFVDDLLVQPGLIGPLTIRRDGDCLWASGPGVCTVGWYLYKIDRAAFRTEGSVREPGNVHGGPSHDIAVTKDYIWFGVATTQTFQPDGTVVRVKKADQSVTYVPPPFGSGYHCSGVYCDGRYIWAAYHSAPAMLMRIDTATLEALLFILSSGGLTGVSGDESTLYFTLPSSRHVAAADLAAMQMGSRGYPCLPLPA